MFRRIDHIAFVVKDRAKSIQFYEEHFGFKKYFELDIPVPAIEKVVYLKLGDTTLELVHIPDAVSPANQGFHFCLESDNFDADYTQLKNVGIPINSEPQQVEEREPKEKGWRRVVFTGPDGEWIEFRG